MLQPQTICPSERALMISCSFWEASWSQQQFCSGAQKELMCTPVRRVPVPSIHKTSLSVYLSMYLAISGLCISPCCQEKLGILQGDQQVFQYPNPQAFKLDQVSEYSCCLIRMRVIAELFVEICWTMLNLYLATKCMKAQITKFGTNRAGGTTMCPCVHPIRLAPRVHPSSIDFHWSSWTKMNFSWLALQKGHDMCAARALAAVVFFVSQAGVSTVWQQSSIQSSK